MLSESGVVVLLAAGYIDQERETSLEQRRAHNAQYFCFT